MVYEKFFYLTENPFNITPDPKFLYLSKKHQEALDLLCFGISERKGFLMLSGEVGTGKTTLCRALLDKLDANVKSALILNPLLSDTELIRAINEDFGLRVDSSSLKEQVDALNSFLMVKAGEGGNAVVIIDEAQNLSPKALEMIRLLSNLETEKMKLIQIVLVGQPELREKLKLPELRQLNQRIVVRYHLSPLEFEETKAYIFNRLSIAGGQGGIKFTSTALKSIHEASCGIPRLINIVCDRILTAAFVSGKRVIDDEIEKKAVDELNMDGTLTKDVEIPHKKLRAVGRRPSIRYISYLSVSVIIIAVLFAVWWDSNKQDSAPLVASTPDTPQGWAIKNSATVPATPVTNKVEDQSLPSSKDVHPGISPSETETAVTSDKAMAAAKQSSHQMVIAESSSSSSKPKTRSDEAVPVSSEQKLVLVNDQVLDMKTDQKNVDQPSELTIVRKVVKFTSLIIRVNDVEHTLFDGETLEVAKGDQLVLVDAIVDGATNRDVLVNFHGFIPKGIKNTGEDRGYLVDTAKDLEVKYSVKKQGAEYPIWIKNRGKNIGEVFIKIVSSKE